MEDKTEEEEARFMGWGMALESAILAVLCRRFGSIERAISILQAREYERQDLREIEAIAERAATSIGQDAERAYNALSAYMTEDAAAFYEAAGKAQGNVLKPIDTAKAATWDTIGGLCQTDVMRIVAPDGRRKPIREAYRDIASKAIASVRDGRPNYGELREAVEALGKGGVSVEYASGATRELYSALSMNVMDGYRNAMAEIRDNQAEEFGADGWEVSSHSLCAPDHLPYQGRQYSFEEMERIQRRLKRPIGKGYNCRHRLTKVKLGVSSSKTAEELKAIERESAREVEWVDVGGARKLGTVYEFSQAQRRMEQRIRKLRMQSQLAEEAGYQDAAQQLRGLSRQAVSLYNAQCKRCKVATRPDRYRVYSLKK